MKDGPVQALDVPISPAIRGVEPSATLAINERSNALRRQGRLIYKLGLGQSPFPVPPVVVEALRANGGEKDYLPVKGLPSLREAVAGNTPASTAFPATGATCSSVQDRRS